MPNLLATNSMYGAHPPPEDPGRRPPVRLTGGRSDAGARGRRRRRRRRIEPAAQEQYVLPGQRAMHRLLQQLQKPFAGVTYTESSGSSNSHGSQYRFTVMPGAAPAVSSVPSGSPRLP